MRAGLPALALLLLCASSSRAQDPYDALADGVAEAVRASSATAVEMLPLVNAAGPRAPQGRMLSGRLLARLTRRCAVPFVLGAWPATSPRPRADVMVQGSYMVVRDRIKLEVQAIEAATGRILYAGDADLRNEWETMPQLWGAPAAAPEAEAKSSPPDPLADLLAKP